MAAKFEVKKGKSGQFSFNLKATNGQVILSSETYKEKRSALAGIASVRKNGVMDGRFDRRTAKDGSPYFVLLAANKEVIGKSEMYKSKTSMENGIASVKKNSPEAVLTDLTA